MDDLPKIGRVPLVTMQGLWEGFATAEDVAIVGEFLDCSRSLCTPRQWQVIVLMLRGHTLEEAGHRMGISRERVKQIESQAIGKLLSRLFFEAVRIGDREYAAVLNHRWMRTK